MAIVLDGTSGITNDSGYTGDGVSFADAAPPNTLVTTGAGNLGVGTASPNERVTVTSSTSGSYVQICDSSTGTTSGDGLFLGSFNGLAELKTKENNGLTFGTNNTERVRIDSDGRFGIGVVPSTAVPTSLQYARVGRRHIASGGMSGSTWINTGVSFTPSNSYCFVLVDVLGNENGRNNGFRRYIMFYNIYSGWATTGAIINNQHGNDYGLVDARYTSTVEIKAANNVSSGPYFLYATEYLL